MTEKKKKKKPVTVKAATEKAREHLQTLEEGPAKAYIFTWPIAKNHKAVGIRVAECGWSTDSGGACYMHSDPSGLAVCAAVERLIVEFLNGDDSGDADSEVERQIELLDYIIKNGAK